MNIIESEMISFFSFKLNLSKIMIIPIAIIKKGSKYPAKPAMKNAKLLIIDPIIPMLKLKMLTILRCKIGIPL